MKFKAIIFDLDGTLLNTLKDLFDSMNHALDACGYGNITLEQTRSYVGNGMMIHCGNPISYASIEIPYWQQHFYCFGRL